jgi:hypothetical protein
LFVLFVCFGFVSVKNGREKSKVSFGLLFFDKEASIDFLLSSVCLFLSRRFVLSVLFSSLLMTASRCCRRRRYGRSTSLFSLSLEKYSFARALE